MYQRFLYMDRIKSGEGKPLCLHVICSDGDLSDAQMNQACSLARLAQGLI